MDLWPFITSGLVAILCVWGLAHVSSDGFHRRKEMPRSRHVHCRQHWYHTVRHEDEQHILEASAVQYASQIRALEDERRMSEGAVTRPIGPLPLLPITSKGRRKQEAAE